MASPMKLLAAGILILLEISLFLTSTMANERNQRYCGRVLTESLALICDGEYGGIFPSNHKRSDESMDEEVYSDQMGTIVDELPLQYQTYAYLSKLLPDVTSLKPRSRRDWMQPRRGVYDECCRKTCSVAELRSYCKRKD